MTGITSVKSANRSIFQQFESAEIWCQLFPENTEILLVKTEEFYVLGNPASFTCAVVQCRYSVFDFIFFLFFSFLGRD